MKVTWGLVLVRQRKAVWFEHAMKGGIGTASIQRHNHRRRHCAVNAAGDIIDPQNGKSWQAHAPLTARPLMNIMEQLRRGSFRAKSQENTTIGVVATNVSLSKSQVNKMAQMAYDGLA
jgi:L-aminopeptidase/D-esterase-like protein